MVYTSLNNAQIIEWLKANLNEERFIHSIGTADCAKELALKFGLNAEKAYVAGLLHDCAKCLENSELLNIINANLKVEACELINPKTYHAPVGAFIAKRDFGVGDEEILSSIRWHTLGHLEMNNFDKIIFLADKIEPNTRCKEYRDKMLEVLDKKGLDAALLICYQETIKSLVERNLKICVNTIEIYNELLNKV